MQHNKNTLPIILTSAVIIGAVALYAYEKSTEHPAPVPTKSAPPSLFPERADAKCHMRGLLPDPQCTPGAINPAVTQANIKQTICVKGYTQTIRPSSSYTNKLKREQMFEYGFEDDIRTHEEDHLISLELGGAPKDALNLWPEPENSPNPKDRIENILHAAVCAGRISLHDAQVHIATDWTTAANGLS